MAGPGNVIPVLKGPGKSDLTNDEAHFLFPMAYKCRSVRIWIVLSAMAGVARVFSIVSFENPPAHHLSLPFAGS